MIKCKSCIDNATEVMNQMNGLGQKNVSVCSCQTCGTLYIGTVLEANHNGEIPNNAFMDNGLLYIPVQSLVTNKYLNSIK